MADRFLRPHFGVRTEQRPQPIYLVTMCHRRFNLAIALTRPVNPAAFVISHKPGALSLLRPPPSTTLRAPPPHNSSRQPLTSSQPRAGFLVASQLTLRSPLVLHRQVSLGLLVLERSQCLALAGVSAFDTSPPEHAAQSRRSMEAPVRPGGGYVSRDGSEAKHPAADPPRQTARGLGSTDSGINVD